MKMTTKWLLPVIALLFLIGLTVYGQKQSPAKVSWEYKSVFSSSGDVGYVLDDLGAQGWELAAIDLNDTDKNGLKGRTYYLKRAK
jgi:hypothetical protein